MSEYESYESYVEAMEETIRQAVFTWLSQPGGDFNQDSILDRCPPHEEGQMLGIALCQGIRQGVLATVDWAYGVATEDEGSHACNN